MEQLAMVVAALRELEADNQVPKNIKAKVASTIAFLQQDSEMSLKVSRAFQELEQLTEDSNMQSDTRMQIFNIMSLLEVL